MTVPAMIAYVRWPTCWLCPGTRKYSNTPHTAPIRTQTIAVRATCDRDEPDSMWDFVPQPRLLHIDPFVCTFMSTFVMIPGAGGAGWYWHRVVPLLEAAGHQAIAGDLPGPDPAAGLPEYTDLTVAAAKGRDDIVLVAGSLGGFTAPLAAGRLPLRALVLVNAMVPEPGETPGDWWDDTGAPAARLAAAERGGYGTEFDVGVYFLHDVPAEVLATGPGERSDADVVFGSP